VNLSWVAVGALLRRRSVLALLAMWLVGLSSVGAVFFLQHRLDQRRHALVVVAELRKEASDMAPIAFQTTLGVPHKQVQIRLAAAQERLTARAARLTGLSGSNSDSALIMSSAQPLFALLADVSELVRTGNLRQAGFLMLAAVAPGGAVDSLKSALDATAVKYDSEAVRARHLAEIGTLLAVLFVLLAFSLALRRAARLTTEKHELLEKSLEDALTDSLTGLWNRRKLFSDMSSLLAEREVGDVLALGMFDLDGFKAYNDTFGHPAGDALLVRAAQRLNAAVAGVGTAYRIGGDEFCVIARGAGAEAVLEAAQEALGDFNDGFRVRCGLGSVVIDPSEVTLEEALHIADQRLYLDKSAARADEARRARDSVVKDGRFADEVTATRLSAA
jgi:diguanylate cyclase (GGDEF)-like protein